MSVQVMGRRAAISLASGTTMLLGGIKLSNSQPIGPLKLRGALVFAWGEAVEMCRWKGEGESSRVILFQKSQARILSLSKIDENSFIFSDESQGLIYLYRFSTNKAEPIARGSSPAFFSTHSKIAYYHSESSLDHPQLVISHLDNLIAKPQLIDEGPFSSVRQVTVLDRDRFLFSPLSRPNSKLKMYNISNGDLKLFSTMGLMPRFSLGDSMVVCFDVAHARYIVFSLANERVADFNVRGETPVLYLKDYHALITSKESRGLYNFRIALLHESGIQQSDFLLGNAAGQYGSAIWFNA